MLPTKLDFLAVGRSTFLLAGMTETWFNFDNFMFNLGLTRCCDLNGRGVEC